MENSDKPFKHYESFLVRNGMREGTLSLDEICPGVTWEDHTESVASFLYGPSHTVENWHEVMKSIDCEYEKNK